MKKVEKKSDWFSHDYGSRNDPKLRKVRKKYNAAGIGCYWMIVEMLYEQGGQLPLDAGDLAFELKEDEAMILDILTKYDLFENNNEVFWSLSANRRLDIRAEKTEKARKAGIKSAEKRADTRKNPTDVEHPLNDRSTIILNDSKEKEIKKEPKGGNSAASAAPNQSLSSKELKIQARITRENEFGKSLTSYVGEYDRKMIRAFFDYWREPVKSGAKMKWEIQDTWDLSIRLKRWQSNNDKWEIKNNPQLSLDTPDTAGSKIENKLGYTG